jgi:hypothetical protein
MVKCHVVLYLLERISTRKYNGKDGKKRIYEAFFGDTKELRVHILILVKEEVLNGRASLYCV